MVKRRLGALVVAGLAAVVVLAGCGSDGGSEAAAPATTKAKPAAAKENAAVVPVCFDLYRPTVQVGCAENTIGPGGGVVFYDAGSVQPWGRFLEVAPQKWNGALYKCPQSFLTSSCGFNKDLGVEAKTSDAGPNANGDVGKPGAGYRACGQDSKWNQAPSASQDSRLPDSAANLPAGIGTGRSNTEVLRNTPNCVNGQEDAVTKAAGYRGGGLADWFLPSLDELKKLCQFGNRDTIGGFAGTDAWRYASSTTNSVDFGDHTTAFIGLTMSGSCDATNGQMNKARDWDVYTSPDGISRLVRPIRAF